MAIRSRVVRPDEIIEDIEGGQILVVSRDAMTREVLAALDTLLLCGGEFTVSSQRAPTGFADESVSVAGFIRWRSATTATARPQPEHPDQQTGSSADARRLAREQRRTDEALRGEDLPDVEEHVDPDELDIDDQIPTAVH